VPHRSPNVCLRLAGLSERGGAHRCKGGSQEATFIGFADELLFPPEVRFSDAIGVEPRIRSTNVLATPRHPDRKRFLLPAFIASSNPTLVPVLPDQVSFTRSYHLHIHEDHRKAPHVREVSGFIAAEVERNHSLFHEPTARPVASPENMRQNRRL